MKECFREHFPVLVLRQKYKSENKIYYYLKCVKLFNYKGFVYL